MKKSIILVLISWCTITFAQGIKFENTSFKEIQAKAKKEKKLIFLDAYASWCGPCKLMAKNIFTLPTVGEYYNSHFINAKLDMEKGEGVALAKKFKVNAYPTYLFINGDGEVVHRTLGYVEEADFIKFAKDAEDPSRQIGALKSKFDAGEKDADFLKNLISLTFYTEPAYAEKVIIRYFQTKEGQALDKDDINILLSSVNKADGESYQIFKNRKQDIIKVLPLEQYDAINKSFEINSIIEKAYNKDTKKIDEQYFLTEAEKLIGKEKATTLLLKQKAKTALRNKDIATYEKLSLEIYKDYTNVTANELNSAAWNFFEKIDTKSSLQEAIRWTQEAVKKEENYAYTDTLANLYHKVGDKANAKIWAAKAIELAKKSGDDYEDTQKLLNSLQ
ncbi:thioredoxin family protein [Chryseobacterium sp. T1]